MKKIYLKLQGGLGNQLFQWTFGHYILTKNKNANKFTFCSRRQADLEVQSKSRGVLELSPYCSHSVGANKMARKIVSDNEYLDRLWARKQYRFFLEKAIGLYREDPRFNVQQTLDPNLCKVRIASGYFQSFNFLTSVHEAMLREITPVVKNHFNRVKQRYNLPNFFTCVHVRSGDYFNADVNDNYVIGRLNLEFYTKVRKRIEKGPLILIAPEIDSISEIVRVLNPTIILTERETTDWETLAIMANADRFFGANSSLSWWGAWLGSLAKNVVYLPSHWSKNLILDDREYDFFGLKRIPAFWE